MIAILWNKILFNIILKLYCFRFCEIIKNQIFLEINLNFGFIKL